MKYTTEKECPEFLLHLGNCEMWPSVYDTMAINQQNIF
jgi:hypothetical protein